MFVVIVADSLIILIGHIYYFVNSRLLNSKWTKLLKVEMVVWIMKQWNIVEQGRHWIMSMMPS